MMKTQDRLYILISIHYGSLIEEVGDLVEEPPHMDSKLVRKTLPHLGKVTLAVDGRWFMGMIVSDLVEEPPHMDSKLVKDPQFWS